VYHKTLSNNVGIVAIGLALGVFTAAQAADISAEFSGHHVNAGTVTHEIKDGKHPARSRLPLPMSVLDVHGEVFTVQRAASHSTKGTTTIG